MYTTSYGMKHYQVDNFFNPKPTMNGSGNYRIISIEIKDGVVKNLEEAQQIFSVQRLDGIGPAKAIDYRTLNEIKPKIQTER